MKTYYFDFSQNNEAVGVIRKDACVLPAGARVFAMSSKDKNEAYDKIKEDFDIHFIFEDNVPEIGFYAVPFVSIFAYDSSGGLFASVGGITDFESDENIIYISSGSSVFLAADNGRTFLKNIGNWKKNLVPFSSVELFPNLIQAKEKYDFIEL